MKKIQLNISLLLLFPLFLSAQNWQCFFEQNYYTDEPVAQLILLAPPSWQGSVAKVRLEGQQLPSVMQDLRLRNVNRIPLALRSVLDSTVVQVELQVGGRAYQLSTIIRKLPAKKNAVKINHLNGHLVVDNLPFIPMGFYCYSPVQNTLAEEEIGRGFNMMSPYQSINSTGFQERKQYLDRCAALGMKVHYNLLSVAGGGGVGRYRSDADALRKRNLLIQEIQAVKDHPALLGWYICDEPTGSNIQPGDLADTYNLIKSLDPYHPISIVFMNPREAARYSKVMDIVMADPYPIPNRPADEVGEIIQNLVDTFRYQKPVWMVPQAFGGSEHWGREPSPGEIQLMTWLPVIKGASAIQYFIRHGYNAFPKSSLTWDAASRAVKEITNIAPFLFQADEKKSIAAIDKSLEVQYYQKNGQGLLLVLNTQNKPKNFLLKLENEKLPKEAKVLFEDREIFLNQDRLQDVIEAYGRRIYLFSLQEELNQQNLFAQNILLDPSFENSLVPSTPSACYFKLRGDRGATASLDTRMAIHGRHSLRLNTPSYDNGLDVSLFPVQLVKGQSYAITFWARSLEHGGNLFMKMGNGAEQNFELTPYWRPYQWVFEAQGNEATRNDKASLIFSLISAGTAWIDAVQLTPEPRIEFANNPFDQSVEVKIESAQRKDPSISINYTLDGTGPNITSPAYTGPLFINRPVTLKAAVSRGNRRWVTERKITVNMQKADKINYSNPFYKNYQGGGEEGLIDGVLGSQRFTDGKWQGWNKGDIDVTLDYGAAIPMKQVQANFLVDQGNWIYPPSSIEVYASKKGKKFKKIGEQKLNTPSFSRAAKVNSWTIMLNGQSYQYLRFVARRLTVLPEDHPSSGGNPFIFLDEIMLAR